MAEHRSTFGMQLVTMATGQSEEARQAALEERCKRAAESNQQIRQLISMYGAVEAGNEKVVSTTQKAAESEAQVSHQDAAAERNMKAQDQRLQAAEARRIADRRAQEAEDLRRKAMDLEEMADINEEIASRPFDPSEYGL